MVYVCVRLSKSLTRIIFLFIVLLTLSPRTVRGFNAMVKYPTNAILFKENTRYVTDWFFFVNSIAFFFKKFTKKSLQTHLTILLWAERREGHHVCNRHTNQQQHDGTLHKYALSPVQHLTAIGVRSFWQLGGIVWGNPDSDWYSVPVIGTSNKIQGRNTLVKEDCEMQSFLIWEKENISLWQV